MKYPMIEIFLLIMILGLIFSAFRRLRKYRQFNVLNSTLTVEELEQHAKRSALSHTVTSKKNRLYWPMRRINDNYSFILSLYKNLNDDIHQKRAVPPAAEWVLDNFYVIEEQAKSLRRDLVKKDYNNLPILKNGPFKGYTRVHAIAMEFVAAVDGQIDEGTLFNYLEVYQSHSVLFDREIRIIPMMLRIALLENVRIICENISETQKQWNLADEIVERWWSDESVDAEKLISLFKSTIETMEEANPSFIEHLFYRFRRSGRSYINVLKYIDEHLIQFGTTTEAMAQKEHNAQAVSTVSMGNDIISFKYVSSLNWAELFESLSYVERILRQDPEEMYAKMDSHSRGYYLLQIEKLAKAYGVSERHIAQEAVDLAKQAAKDNLEVASMTNYQLRRAHVGFYVAGEGISILEKTQKGKETLNRKVTHRLKKRQGYLYIESILLITLLTIGVMIHYGISQANSFQWFYGVLIFIITLVPASEMAISLVNWSVGKIKQPAFFPRLELKEGIPQSLCTMIVVPTLLSDENRVVELLKNIENHYLANKEANLYFALIGGFKDSTSQNTPLDHPILKKAYEGINALNIQYALDKPNIFYYFHRVNMFNENDQSWTGWERKRGALMEFNDLLLGSKNTSFIYNENNDIAHLKIKYIITLDADTVLPLGMAKKMIGTMAHPLNLPVIDTKRNVVTEGHGLMQPRISFDMDSSNKSIFSKIYTGQEGMDPYASAISDVYQDLFDEGIFTGKGIYDLRVFRDILRDVVPENAVLSHDLLEGSYVRAALVSDLELVDAYPTKYNAYIARLHRWIRGDWQLIPWLSRTVLNKRKEIIKNPLSYISIWKIADNMRRSLVAPSLITLIILGMSILPGSVYYWLGCVAIVISLPLMISIIEQVTGNGLMLRRTKRHISGFFGIKSSLFQLLLTTVFLSFQAAMILNAISITLVRVIITKKKMLEWVTSDDAEKNQNNSLKSYVKSMGFSSLLGLPIIALTYVFKPESSLFSITFLCLWGIAPFVAYYISKGQDTFREVLQQEELEDLRTIAYNTWRYFEEFANERNNFLAPDNYQEEPYKGIAYRTSPTNIGLGLLAILSARDLGYIGLIEMYARLEKTLSTIERMEKWNGHLYNWYDTRTLVALKPRYISTVDSGNFVCYLMTLEQGLKEYNKRTIIDTIGEQGIYEAYDLQQGNSTLTSSSRDFNYFMPWISMIETAPKVLYVGINDFKEFLSNLNHNVPAHKLGEHCQVLRETCAQYIETLERIIETQEEEFPSSLHWLRELEEKLLMGQMNIEEFMDSSKQMIMTIHQLSENTRFSPLYEEKRQLFAIGYNFEDHRLSNSYYDLLASEARQTSYIAIARGEVPPKHWYMLGRSLTVVDRYKGLVSWSGTMFEYLMPLLLMRGYKNTLLDETYSFAIRSQKKYGKERKMPWGSSESAFSSMDINLDYQYKAIGVPWLGLKRGLVEDAVTTPYATFLALMVKPLDAYKNIQLLRKEGIEGKYGFYEAADYTPERLGQEQERIIIKCYMAHHQGMSLLAINNYLNQFTMQKRFSADPYVKAARLLLQEKVPTNVVFTKENKEKIMPFKGFVYHDKGSYRRFTEPNTVLPKAHVLSNGYYSVVTTDKGTGYSRTKDFAITRWREDPILDRYGMFFYIKNKETNQMWSSSYAPFNVIPEEYEVVFTADKTLIKRVDKYIETLTEIIVTSGENAEIRRIRLKNNGDANCNLEVTSYFEVVLTEQKKDEAHPAFSNLFMETEYSHEYKALIAHRRSQTETHNELWLAQMPIIDGEVISDIQYETDRIQFIGRGRTISNPISIERDRPLTNTLGNVLDPIFSLRVKVNVPAGKSLRISFVTLSADSKEQLLELLAKYNSVETCDAAFWLAVIRSQVETKYLNIKAHEIELYQNLISDIIFISPLRRNHEHLIRQNQKGQSALWAYGISGDRPIVLVKIQKSDDVGILFELLKAHEYWRIKDLRVDLVILIMEEYSYANPLFALVTDIVQSNLGTDQTYRTMDVFILNIHMIGANELYLLNAVARLSFDGAKGGIVNQLDLTLATRIHDRKIILLQNSLDRNIDIDHQEDIAEDDKEVFVKVNQEDPELRINTREIETNDMLLKDEYTVEENKLQFFNGIGGFSSDYARYTLFLDNGQTTPLPWSNIIANPEFGFMVTESGGGYTWSVNSRENKLTPWHNDPVCDTPGEIFYLQDEDLNLWSMTPLPIRETSPYRVEHGFGYTSFEHTSHEIRQSLIQFVPLKGSAKISLISLNNESTEIRRVVLTYFIQPILGVNSTETSIHLVSSLSEEGIISIENPYNRDFLHQALYISSSAEEMTCTGNRKEFFGQGDYKKPEGLIGGSFSNQVGAGFDPCLAIQVEINLQPKATFEVVFVMGIAEEATLVYEQSKLYTTVKAAKKHLEEVKEFWNQKLRIIQVQTPDTAFDQMMNGRLMYQVIACRLWARTAYYQAGGAFGFRDQLQDSLALLEIWPELTRAQIIKHAQHQFIEGDVLHWWHEPKIKGTRTRISDDFLWLPFVIAKYITVTQDFGILNEDIYYLEAEGLKDNEDERYLSPKVSEECGTMYEHCIRAIEHGLQLGEHGLPLMGGGDWNDGMNRVGNEGKGESVWLAWFLVAILKEWSPLCMQQGQQQRGEALKSISDELVDSIEKNGWDGNWYKRAFFDDGSQLGSSNNSECKIDSLAQSWSVLSGAGDLERSKQAMIALEDYLVSYKDGIIKLLTPPFDTSELDPGYIKGYVPGVRENGGQYTHAAAWVIAAFAKLGDGDKAFQLFELINPINHARTNIELAIYKVEPYVMAADVYGCHPHIGRGGWTWYTGAAGWMYQTGLKNILGFTKEGTYLYINPCIPKKWSAFSINYTYEGTLYEIHVNNPDNLSTGRTEITLDGTILTENKVLLIAGQDTKKIVVLMIPN